MVLVKSLLDQRKFFFSKFVLKSEKVSINPGLILPSEMFTPQYYIIKKTSHLKVVDRLERVYAGNLAVLEPQQDRLEVFSSIARVLADEEKVRLDRTEIIDNVKMVVISHISYLLSHILL